MAIRLRKRLVPCRGSRTVGWNQARMGGAFAFERGAKVAELADAPDLGSGGETHEGSSPSFRTNIFCLARPGMAGRSRFFQIRTLAPHIDEKPGVRIFGNLDRKS